MTGRLHQHQRPVVDISAVIGTAITGHPLLAGTQSPQGGKGGTTFADIVQALQALPNQVDPVQDAMALLAGPPGSPALPAGLPGSTILPVAQTRTGGVTGEQAEEGGEDAAEGGGPGIWFLPMSAADTPAPAQVSLRPDVVSDKPAARFPAADIAARRQGLPPQVTVQLSDQVPQGEVAEALLPMPAESPVQKAMLVPADGALPPAVQQALPLERAAEALVKAGAPGPSTPPGVTAALNSREWSTDFAQRVVWMVGQRAQFAEIAVNPPNLGGVEVRLSLNDQTAGAQFFSPHASVREALEAALPRLRDMMAEAGISLGQAEVRDQAFEGRGEWGLAQHPEPELHGQVSEMTVRMARGHGLIDLYA